MTRLRLEEFAHGQPTETVAEEEDTAGLAAYEEGYAAGWEDAVAAQSDQRAELSAEIGRSLAALTLSRQEARSEALRLLEPLLVEIGTRLLPEIARSALAPTVSGALLSLAEAATDAPFRLRVGPGGAEAIGKWLEACPDLTVEVTEDPNLSGGQVLVSSGGGETRVDLDAAAAAILGAIRDFFDLHEMERRDAE